MKPRQHKGAKTLYGPTVQYADGTVAKGTPLDVEQILSAFERLDGDARRSFLCVFAHDLTVAVRALLLDRPVSPADLDRVWKINEVMHQLTSCANPDDRWSAHDSAVLIRDIVEMSFSYGLVRYVAHALATAAGSTIAKHHTIAAK